MSTIKQSTILNNGQPYLSFNRTNAARFKKAYLDAVAKNKDQFVWEGHGFLINYAKYLIEYLEINFGTLKTY